MHVRTHTHTHTHTQHTHTHTSQGAESLLVNGVNNPLCISMADAMATKLKPPVWEKQVELDSFVCAGKFNHFHRLTLHLHTPPLPCSPFPLVLLSPFFIPLLPSSPPPHIHTHIHTQHNGAGVLKLRAQTPQIWHRIWHLTLKLSTTLLSSLGHQYVPHSLDFTAVYQERMNKVRPLSY